MLFYYWKGEYMSIAMKSTRINIRLSEKDKDLLELAASHSNQSLSNYVISIAIKQAELDLKKDEMIVLNNEQWKQVLECLDNPGEPNEALKGLFK